MIDDLISINGRLFTGALKKTHFYGVSSKFVVTSALLKKLKGELIVSSLEKLVVEQYFFQMCNAPIGTHQ